MEKHPGFKGAAASVAAREHVPMKNARAIIGAASHNASKKAVAKNPRLKRVPGVGSGKKKRGGSRVGANMMSYAMGQSGASGGGGQ